MIKLGVQAKDKVTGFEGIVIGKSSWLTGCDTYGIAPPAKDGEVKDARWFDEGRVVVLGPGVTVEEVKTKKTGGPHSEAPRVY